MAAILGLSAELITTICSQVSDDFTPLPGTTTNFSPDNAVVAPANFNSPDQTVISGSAAAVARAAELCKQAGAKRTVMLQVSAPFHCALMQPAQKALLIDLEGMLFIDPPIPVASNVDARFTTRNSDTRDSLLRQVTGPVRWVECIQLLASQPITQFIEVGPGKVLTGLNRQILGKDSAIPTLNVEDSASLEKTLAALNPREQPS
jgi:[acyl-carrier-protein] S-malonyltransferase